MELPYETGKRHADQCLECQMEATLWKCNSSNSHYAENVNNDDENEKDDEKYLPHQKEEEKTD